MESKSLTIGFLTPYFVQPRGNATTAKRIVTGLQDAGLTVHIFAYEEQKWNEHFSEIFSTCDIIHVLHFSRFINWQRSNTIKFSQPIIFTSGGTDVNHDLFDKQKQHDIDILLTSAAAITVFTEDGKQKVDSVCKRCKQKTAVIPQSVWFPKGQSATYEYLPPGFPNVLLPAGLRPVKDVLYLLDAFRELKVIFPDLTFSIVGTVLDTHVYEQVKKAERKYAWMNFFEDIPLEDMPTFYKWADVVVNSSVSEGQSSAIIEGMYYDNVIFARKNAGNESLITDEVNGLIFTTPSEFKDKFTYVLKHEGKLKLITKAGKKFVNTHHHFKQEIERYIKLYQQQV